jgi:hypothetical protein
MSAALNREDLYSLEEYARIRPDFRRRVMEHKRNRRVPLGPHATLYFEDRMTMHYQVQEMLRAERIFEAEGIEEELQAYNPLIPDGTNLKATFMIEYEDSEERRQALARLLDVENRVWLRVDGFEPVTPIADEDLERSTEDKTSSVHFLRFEFSNEMISALKQGAELSAGCDHPELSESISPLPTEIRDSLVSDLN